MRVYVSDPEVRTKCPCKKFAPDMLLTSRSASLIVALMLRYEHVDQNHF